jgi:glutamate synthase domain-containing protein 2
MSNHDTNQKRGGGTGTAPLIFRNNISVPTIPALARARHYLDKINRKDIKVKETGVYNGGILAKNGKSASR